MKHLAEILLLTIATSVVLFAFYMVNVYGQDRAYIPQPWSYEIHEGEAKRSLIVTYIGPEGDVEYDMHHIRTTMREFPSIYCEGDFQPGLIRELNGRTGDLEIVCVYQWEDFTRGGRH